MNFFNLQRPTYSQQVGLQNKSCFDVRRITSGLLYENSTELDKVAYQLYAPWGGPNWRNLFALGVMSKEETKTNFKIRIPAEIFILTIWGYTASHFGLTKSRKYLNYILEKELKDLTWIWRDYNAREIYPPVSQLRFSWSYFVRWYQMLIHYLPLKKSSANNWSK